MAPNLPPRGALAYGEPGRLSRRGRGSLAVYKRFRSDLRGIDCREVAGAALANGAFMSFSRVSLVMLTALGCTPPPTLSLLHTQGAPITATPSEAIPLEVVTRSTGVKDPVDVRGGHYAYGDIENIVGMAVSSAASPWAEKHKGQRPEGWQLQAELIQADAQYDDDRLIVTLGVRLTLRARSDRHFIAQSQAGCRQSALRQPRDGADVVYACINQMGRDTASWLALVEP